MGHSALSPQRVNTLGQGVEAETGAARTALRLWVGVTAVRDLSGGDRGRGLSGGDSGREFDLGPMADGWVGVGVGTVGAVGCGDLVCMSGWPCC
jgi:hypothetical protein